MVDSLHKKKIQNRYVRKDRNVSAIYEVHCKLFMMRGIDKDYTKSVKKPVFEFGGKQFVPCSGIPYVKNFQFLKDTAPPPSSRSNAQCSCKLKHYMHANNVSHQQRPRGHSWWNTHFSVPFFSPQQWQRRLDERTICRSTTSWLFPKCNDGRHGRQSGVSY